jgi:hypothetical protein
MRTNQASGDASLGSFPDSKRHRRNPLEQPVLVSLQTTRKVSKLDNLPDRTDVSDAALKALLAAAAALAIVIGLTLPVPGKGGGAQPKSQFTTLDLGRG